MYSYPPPFTSKLRNYYHWNKVHDKFLNKSFYKCEEYILNQKQKTADLKD